MMQLFNLVAFDLWQQLDLAVELKSEIQVIKIWQKRFLVNFNASRTQLLFFNLIIQKISRVIDKQKMGLLLIESIHLRL